MANSAVLAWEIRQKFASLLLHRSSVVDFADVCCFDPLEMTAVHDFENALPEREGRVRE